MDSYFALFVAVARPLLICFVTASALLGLLAVVSPRTFLSVVTTSNHWVDTNKFFGFSKHRFFQWLDKRVDMDQYALRYGRLTGIVILTGAVILGSLYLVG